MATQQIQKIEANPRDSVGTHSTKALRTSGQMPAVIYGHKQDPVHISFNQKQITDLLHTQAHIVEVVVGAKTEPCLIKDVQWDHLGAHILHVDLARVDMTEKVTVNVEIELLGEAIGLKQAGAFLQHPMDEIQVECLASQIPDKITIDISALDAGQSLNVSDLQLPSGVVAIDDPETMVASIQIVEEEPEEVPAVEAAAEPEVIGKKETPDEQP